MKAPRIGHPPEEWRGFVWLPDVLKTIDGMDAGVHHRDDIYEAYKVVVLADNRTGGTPSSFGTAIKSLGAQRVFPDRWRIDPREMLERHKHLVRHEPEVDPDADDPWISV